MAIAKIKVKKSKSKKKNVAVLTCDDVLYGEFALIRNQGILPLNTDQRIGVVECKKSKNIKTSQALFNALFEWTENKQHVYVSHILGKNPKKPDVKKTVKQTKKCSAIILYIGSDVKSDTAEVVALAKAIKKRASLILCYHKTGCLLDKNLALMADAIFLCANRDKDAGKALFDLMIGRGSPYARVNIDESEPYRYSFFDKANTEYFYKGCGLSFVDIAYTNVLLSRYTAKVGEKIEVHVTVTNNSKTETCDVVQLYVTSRNNEDLMLIDSGKLVVRPLESVVVAFEIDTSQLDYSGFEDNEAYSFCACVGKSSVDVINIPFRVIF